MYTQFFKMRTWDFRLDSEVLNFRLLNSQIIHRQVLKFLNIKNIDPQVLN